MPVRSWAAVRSRPHDLVRLDRRRHLVNFFVNKYWTFRSADLSERRWWWLSVAAFCRHRPAAAAQRHPQPAPRSSGLAPGRHRRDRAQLRAAQLQHSLSADRLRRRAAELRRAGTADRAVPGRDRLQALRRARSLRPADRDRVRPRHDRRRRLLRALAVRERRWPASPRWRSTRSFPAASTTRARSSPTARWCSSSSPALYAWSRWIVDDDGSARIVARRPGRVRAARAGVSRQASRAAGADSGRRAAGRRASRWQARRSCSAASLVPLALYGPYVAAHAEWHWASGIMRLHVIPSFVRRVHVAARLRAQGDRLRESAAHARDDDARAGRHRCCWSPVSASACARAPTRCSGAGSPAGSSTPTSSSRSSGSTTTSIRCCRWARSSAATSIARVARTLRHDARTRASRPSRPARACCGSSRSTSTAARSRRTTPGARTSTRARSRSTKRSHPGALIVMGHYDPSLMYYIRRKGWMEDPYLWTPFDEQSAIRKGARYFIAVEPKRLARNVELCALARSVSRCSTRTRSGPSTQTDPAKMLPGAEARWQEFRRANASNVAVTVSPRLHARVALRRCSSFGQSRRKRYLRKRQQRSRGRDRGVGTFRDAGIDQLAVLHQAVGETRDLRIELVALPGSPA